MGTKFYNKVMCTKSVKYDNCCSFDFTLVYNDDYT